MHRLTWCFRKRVSRTIKFSNGIKPSFRQDRCPHEDHQPLQATPTCRLEGGPSGNIERASSSEGTMRLGEQVPSSPCLAARREPAAFAQVLPAVRTEGPSPDELLVPELLLSLIMQI
uniref:Uncharacterized protein n=1 Tax=Sphaerodactylus townsendi TaxID=933632 RepID=A0ACB8ER81_9SAUR